MISSKQRIIRALQHKQPDTIPVDFGATSVTGIHCKVVESLRAYYGLEKRPVRIIEPFQMLGEIDEELKQIMHLDCEHVFGSYDMLDNDNDRLHTQRTPWGQEVLIAQGIDLTPDRNNDVWLYPQGDRTAAPSAVLSDGCYFMNAIERCGEIDDSQMNPEDNLEEYGFVWKLRPEPAGPLSPASAVRHWAMPLSYPEYRSEPPKASAASPNGISPP